ncbi:pilus assembly protein TadG-related protein [Streptomyces sp. SCSIO 30461]|uniref:pilus assembly protein TadG-related protein n=1 Tax=Streptomyces sp. SCSIO 30461 TaxID=3118085 RepID=UPI0030D43C92
MIENARDRGQAFPIYIMMVAGLLFLAFAFFAVGKASAVRNGAQGAADAAALAAAQAVRNAMGSKFLAALLVPNGLEQFFKEETVDQAACAEAQYLAGANRADLVPNGSGDLCDWSDGNFRDDVTVQVMTRYTVGSSVIPGSESRHATAKASAAVEFRCSWEVVHSSVGVMDEKDGRDGLIEFSCDGLDVFTVDPLRPDSWEKLSKELFVVHLIDD